jgi:major capsid protein gp7
MSTLSGNALTLADWAKRLDPDGKVPQIIELLSQTNGLLDDMLFVEGNLPTGHRTTIRTGLPTAAWRLLNGGVQPSKSTTAQIDEACGMLEAWSEVDVDLAMLNGNTGEFRLSEAQAFIEAMNQEMAQTVFYGNSGTAPEEFTGLAARYSSLSATNASNIVSGGGAGSDNASIYLIAWGANTVHGIFPKGSKAGLSHQDLGEQTIEVTAGVVGTRMRAFQDRWQWKTGIALKDWRYVVRIPNIDISNLVGHSSACDLNDKMSKAIHRLPNLNMGKPVFYMNRSCFQELDYQRREDVISGGGLTMQNVEGEIKYSFRGIPIKICDALLETEATVS